MEMQRFAEPIDTFALQDWQGGEIYEGESYLEMPNGDIVINDIGSMVEWVNDHSIFKTAEVETQ